MNRFWSFLELAKHYAVLAVAIPCVFPIVAICGAEAAVGWRGHRIMTRIVENGRWYLDRGPLFTDLRNERKLMGNFKILLRDC